MTGNVCCDSDIGITIIDKKLIKKTLKSKLMYIKPIQMRDIDEKKTNKYVFHIIYIIPLTESFWVTSSWKSIGNSYLRV